MFQAAPCSSSGGQIVLLQLLILSLSVKYSMPVESGLQSALNRHTVRLFTESDDTRGCKADCSPLLIGILYDCLQRVTVPEAVIIQFVLLKMSKVLLETC